jgi:hypothetical protein
MTEEKTATELKDSTRWTGQERRCQPRRRSRGHIFALFTIPPNPTGFRVPVWDASLSGISFLRDYPLKPETILSFQLAAGLSGVSWVRSAQVVHATPHEGKWLIGCRVNPPFSERELEDLMSFDAQIR